MLVTLKTISLLSILGPTPIDSIPLRSAPLRSVLLRSAPLRSVPSLMDLIEMEPDIFNLILMNDLNARTILYAVDVLFIGVPLYGGVND